MEFDHLLRKYLSGTMSEMELEQFQGLLDRVPEYKAELRQILELRSLLHDDALTLTPPADLSEHIRIAVSSSFAADAIAEWEEESRLRRSFLNPLRITAGALVATCLFVGVALTPTLPPATALLSDRSAQTSGLATVAAPAPTISQVRDAASRNAGGDRIPQTAAAADQTITRLQGGIDEDLSMLGPEFPYRVASLDEAPDRTMAQNSGERSTLAIERATILQRDPIDLLRRNTEIPSYNPQLDSATQRALPAVTSVATPGDAITMAGENGRRLSIGVTLGSGSMVENVSPTALLQNSYYFSFSLSGHDRVGVEMGLSKFEREEATASPFGKQGVDDERFFVAAGLGGRSGGYVGLLADGASSMGLVKKSIDDLPPDAQHPTIDPPRERGDKSNGGTPTPKKDPPPSTANTPSITEQSTVYGAVFYDRRVKLSRSWDLCGRVTFGGADNGVLTNVRAYAAFSPGNKNITLTMGVGGSTLFNFAAKERSTSHNLGVYYGIETGF